VKTRTRAALAKAVRPSLETICSDNFDDLIDREVCPPIRRRGSAGPRAPRPGRPPARPAARARASAHGSADAEVVQFPHLPPGGVWRSPRSPPSRLSCSRSAAAYLVGHESRLVSRQAGRADRTAERACASSRRDAETRRQLADGARGQQPADAARPARVLRALATRDGKPLAPCGSFRVNARTTTVRLSVPYNCSRASAAG